MNWPTIRDHLRAKFRVVRDDDAAVAVRLGLHAGEREVAQDVGLSPGQVHGRAWLVVLAPVCAAVQLPPAAALAYQDRIAFGALVPRHQTLLLRHGVVLEHLTPALLDWTIAAVAHEAVRLRINLRLPAETTAFTHYAE